MKEDNRYCYGVNCTWNGSIHEVSNTKDHPKHKAIAEAFPTVKVGGRTLNAKDFALPCCPYCGSMLMQVDSKEIWDRDVAKYNENHPGYKAMWEWSVKQKKCFRTVGELAVVFERETGIAVTL